MILSLLILPIEFFAKLTATIAWFFVTLPFRAALTLAVGLVYIFLGS